MGARKWANRRFGHVYERMAKDRKTLDRNMGAAVANLNDQLAKQSALADSSFSTTVKNIKAARIAAAKDVQNARKYFTTEIVALTSKIKQQETRLRGDIQVVSAMVISDKANQIRINGKVKAERNKIVKIANARHSSNVRANENIAVTKKGLASQIAVQVENMADNVFRLVQGNRQKIADNYLSLKAYAATAADKITDYLSKGKAAPGEGFGSPTIPLIFSGKNVKIAGAISKINGLVNEYIKTVGQVRARWPMGLGKYLIAKLET